MRYIALGSCLYFLNGQFMLTFDAEDETWLYGKAGFLIYPVSRVFDSDRLVWNDRII